MKKIEWNKQHCGIIQGEYKDVINLMPDLKELLDTFPKKHEDYLWDVKVHMLMPNQFPCIPNWHRDMIPRDENLKEDESKIDDTKDMYLWLSGTPLTLFRDENGNEYEMKPNEWKRFTQRDWHRGQISEKFQWRGLIRATHKGLRIKSKNVNNPFNNSSPLRRHCQVYVDANTFKW